MELKNGVKRRTGRSTSKSKSQRGGGRKPSIRRTKKVTLPKTASNHSRRPTVRLRMSRASSNMSLTDLQFLAKDRGIPFGGLSRAKLVKKINNYMY